MLQAALTMATDPTKMKQNRELREQFFVLLQCAAEVVPGVWCCVVPWFRVWCGVVWCAVWCAVCGAWSGGVSVV